MPLRAVVTGSTRGLGEAIARDLAARGGSVVVNGTTAETCNALAGELGAAAVVGSVAEADVAERLVSVCCETYGGIDLLVNNAGFSHDGMLGRLTPEQFDAVVDVHLRGSWLTSRAAAQAMRTQGGGSIVNVVSGTALYGNLGQSPYAAAKGGLLGMTRALSLELARSGVRVNAISPIARTTMIDPLLALDPSLESHFGDPAEIAPLVAYLGPRPPPTSPGRCSASTAAGSPCGATGVILRHETRPAPWTPGDIGAMLGDDLAELQPDDLGAAVLTALGIPTAARVP